MTGLLAIIGGGLSACALYHFARATYALFKLWRLFYGNWQSDQADSGCAQNAAVAAQHAACYADTVYPGGLTWVDSGKATMTGGFGLPGLPPLPPLPTPSFLGFCSAPTVIPNCRQCGAVISPGDGHRCPDVSQTDLDAVRTIQTLAANGLSGEEIAADMGLVVGWRAWTAGGDLSGAGTGSVARWPLDVPTLAVCINPMCARDGAREACARSEKPSCRVHAVKTRDQVTYPGIVGMVALWGDVIECEGGYLASRAYPLAFESPAWARAYRVATIGEGGNGSI